MASDNKKKETLAYFANILSARRADLHSALDGGDAAKIKKAHEAANEARKQFKAALESKQATLQKAVDLL